MFFQMNVWCYVVFYSVYDNNGKCFSNLYWKLVDITFEGEYLLSDVLQLKVNPNKIAFDWRICSTFGATI